MLTIDTLSLRLPPGYEHRAERIGRLLAEALADLDAGSLTLDHLALPPVAVAGDASDGEVAARIAASVRTQLAKGRR